MSDKTILILCDCDWFPEDVCEYGAVCINTSDLEKVTELVPSIEKMNKKNVIKAQKYNKNKVKPGTIGWICPDMVPNMKYEKPLELFMRILSENNIEVELINYTYTTIGG